MVSENSKHRLVVCHETHFHILNRVDVDHECDGQTDGQDSLASSSLELISSLSLC